MRKISGNDKAFSKLIQGKDEVIYNVLYLIREGENPFIVTDDESYIIAQSVEQTPMWVYLNKKPKDKKEEIVQIILDRLSKNSELKLIASEENIQEVLDTVSIKSNIKYCINMRMNVYSCTKVNNYESLGKIVHPSKKYRDIMAKLIIQMEKDAEKNDVSKKDAYGYADDNADSKKIFLLEDIDSVTAMAKVGHKTDKYARINTVVTERSARNKGYAKMLVGEMCKMLLNENLIPMLYADSINPASNAAYKKIGFEKQGEVTEFKFMLC